MKLDPGEAEEGRFQLIPLIDVVFLLLVFFLASTTFSRDEVEMDLELPRSETGQRGENHLLVISVTRDGRIFFRQRETTARGLREKLFSAYESDPHQEVLIRGDKNVAFGRVALVFDACLKANFKNISIAAEPGVK